MRLSTRAAGLVLALGLVSAPALAEDLQFSFVNATGAAVTEIYISPVGVDSWEDNLVSSALAPGETGTATIADGRSVCEYDIKTVFDDGDTAESRNVNLCELGTYTVHE
ncbi:hypothetical protein [Zavarzinia sp. CC-PAN008]|uniref:hypothetical protein n=1 Tax=Zavarzinia sp. CC-PAN008 TaxID=3243332 RepID=UPI003F74ABB2